MDIKYGLLLKKSWNDLKKNMIIFLPIVFAILFTIGFGIILLVEFLIFNFTFGFSKANFVDVGFLTSIIIVGIIDFIILLIISSAIKGMYIGLLNKITTKKKAYSKDMWEGMRKFTFVVFRIVIILLLTLLIPLVVFGLIIGAGFLASKMVGIVLAIIFGGIFLLYLIAWAIFFGIGLIFMNPVISLGKSYSAMDLIKKTLKYAKEHIGHVALTWLIIFVINAVVSILNQIVSLPGKLFPLLLIITIPLLVLLIIVRIVIEAWLKIFVFNSYFNKNLKKL